MDRRELFAQRVREVVDSYARDGTSLRELARQSGLHVATISHWQSGTRSAPRDESLDLFCNYTGVDRAWLLGLRDEAQPQAIIDQPAVDINGRDFVLVPRVAEQVAAGSPVLDLSEVAEERDWYAFRRGWVKHLRAENDPNRLAVVQVARDYKGESMIPSIQPGAMLVIDRGPRGQGVESIENGKVYLVRDPEEEGVMVKRLFQSRDQLVFWSDNYGTHPPITVPMRGRSIRDVVIGRVVLIQQEEV